MIKRSVATGCVVFGSILLYIGYDKTQSVMGGLKKTFSGGYSGETIAYLAGGGVLLLVGLGMLFGKKKGGR
jgi:hypothetical protein